MSIVAVQQSAYVSNAWSPDIFADTTTSVGMHCVHSLAWESDVSSGQTIAQITPDIKARTTMSRRARSFINVDIIHSHLCAHGVNVKGRTELWILLDEKGTHEKLHRGPIGPIPGPIKSGDWKCSSR